MEVEDLVLNANILSQEEVKSEEGDFLEIIEEISDDGAEDLLMEMLQHQQHQQSQDDEEHKDEDDNDDNDAARGSHGHDFSLSNITFAIGGALHASTANLGWATAHLLQEAQSKSVQKLRASLSHMNLPSSPSEGGGSSSHSASSRSLPTKWSDHQYSYSRQQQRQVPRKSCVNFGSFESRASRLQYTEEDLFNIADNQEQFEDLQEALRSMGAITNTLLKQKLHWYVKNCKRARAAQERQQQQQQLSAEEGTITPPTESKVLDKNQVLQLATDPSPTSVHGIFVPPG